jgi:hypothetical protein
VFHANDATFFFKALFGWVNLNNYHLTLYTEMCSATDAVKLVSSFFRLSVPNQGGVLRCNCYIRINGGNISIRLFSYVISRPQLYPIACVATFTRDTIGKVNSMSETHFTCAFSIECLDGCTQRETPKTAKINYRLFRPTPCFHLTSRSVHSLLTLIDYMG